MTALAGYWAYGGGAEDPRATCAAMLKAQAIYAPRAPSEWSSGDIALGKRLFATLPEDRHDQGPVTGGGGRWTLVGDIRLDNRPELCAELGIDRHRAATLSDSAIVLEAVERWESEAVARLVGDFAIALWDRQLQRLLLARDFLGQRPLHFHRSAGFFAFSSMAKGLHVLPQVPPAPDAKSVAAFVALIPESGSETFFAGVEKVRPGHLVTVTRDGVRSERWWTYQPKDLGLKTAGDYAEALREHFDRAVADRLRGAEGGVASHLSGGLDSSSVTATAARLLAPAGRRLTAFTAIPDEGFAGSGDRNIFVDEGPHAAALAALYPNIDHVLVHNRGSPIAGLDRNFMLYERPVLNLCNAVWADRIKDQARQRKLVILLNGGMGNMSISFDGMAMLSELMAKGRLLRLARESALLVRNGTRFGTVAAQAIGPFLPRPIWAAIARLRGKNRRLTDYTAIGANAADSLAALAADRGLDTVYRPRGDALEKRLWVLGRVDPGNYGKGILAGWGLDVRDPTADRRLVEFCLSVPLDQYLRDGHRRALVRSAFADRLPPIILDETRKGYQAADWYRNLTAAREEIGEEIQRLGSVPQAADTLDVARMSGLVGAWPSGGWNRPATTETYRLALLRGLSAGHFIRKASGSNR